MKSFVLVVSLLLIVLLATIVHTPASASAAQEFELACPAGYAPVIAFNTLNQSTGKWRSNVCVNSTGTMVCQMTGCTGLGAPPS